MRELIYKFWNKIKWGIFLVIWTIGVIGWCYFYQELKTIRCEANWTWNEVQKLQDQKVEIKKDDGKEVESKDETSMQVQPEERTEPKNSVPTSGEIEKIILATFGKDEYQIARAVAFAESRLNPKAIGKNNNGTTDCGVFQINSIHRLEDCQDPHKNIEYAKRLFDKSGWSPWVAYKTGKYLAYIK